MALVGPTSPYGATTSPPSSIPRTFQAPPLAPLSSPNDFVAAFRHGSPAKTQHHHPHHLPASASGNCLASPTTAPTSIKTKPAQGYSASGQSFAPSPPRGPRPMSPSRSCGNLLAQYRHNAPEANQEVQEGRVLTREEASVAARDGSPARLASSPSLNRLGSLKEKAMNTPPGGGSSPTPPPGGLSPTKSFSRSKSANAMAAETLQPQRLRANELSSEENRAASPSGTSVQSISPTSPVTTMTATPPTSSSVERKVRRPALSPSNKALGALAAVTTTTISPSPSKLIATNSLHSIPSIPLLREMPFSPSTSSVTSLANPETPTNTLRPPNTDSGRSAQSASSSSISDPPAPAPAIPDPENGDETVRLGECVVCLERKINSVFIPCGHLSCCIGCGPALKECPICRKAVQQCVRIYSSA